MPQELDSTESSISEKPCGLRYAARLLFCMEVEGHHNDKTYEARIVTLQAANAREALAAARVYGNASEWRDSTETDKTVCCSFLGIIELLNLEGATEAENEVWFDILTEEEAEGLVPPEDSLSAVFNDE